MSEIVRTGLSVGVDNAAGRAVQSDNEELKRVQRAVHYLNRLEPSPSQDEGYPTPTNRLEVGYDDSSRRLVIKLVDSITKAVLLEMPSKEVIHLAANARRASYENPTSEIHTSEAGITA
ncbi:MAG: flagellar protein FlaG [Acidobacteriota bacterium]